MKKENLHNLKHSGFKTPENYFNTLEDQIMSQINLKELSPTSGFKTPDDYFNTIEKRILQQTKQQPKVIKLFNKKTVIMVASAAAVIVLFFNLNLFKNQVTFDSLDTEIVENYILDEIELNDLSSLIDTDQLSQTDFINYKDISIDNYIDDIDLEELFQE